MAQGQAAQGLEGADTVTWSDALAIMMAFVLSGLALAFFVSLLVLLWEAEVAGG